MIDALKGIVMGQESKEKELVRSWLDKNLEEFRNLSNDNCSMILLLSTLDCFAQLWGGFPLPEESNKTFCDFILHYSSESRNLQRVCPVTLFYQYKKHIKVLPLKNSRIYSYDDLYLAELAEEFIKELPTEEQARARKKHQYIKLLYRLRSKLVHEMNNLGTPIEFDEKKPFIASGFELRDGNLSERYWTVCFPRQFLYDLTKETVIMYLNSCDELPKRRLNLSWE